MELRGAVSDKQKLITAFETVYTKATSEQDFYERLREQGMELYNRNDKIVGVKLRRKFRFRKLGYDKEVLQELNKNLSKNLRLDTIRRIREKQNDRSKGRERTKGRDR